MRETTIEMAIRIAISRRLVGEVLHGSMPVRHAVLLAGQCDEPPQHRLERHAMRARLPM